MRNIAISRSRPTDLHASGAMLLTTTTIKVTTLTTIKITTNKNNHEEDNNKNLQNKNKPNNCNFISEIVHHIFPVVVVFCFFHFSTAAGSTPTTSTSLGNNWNLTARSAMLQLGKRKVVLVALLLKSLGNAVRVGGQQGLRLQNLWHTNNNAIDLNPIALQQRLAVRRGAGCKFSAKYLLMYQQKMRACT